MSEHAKLSPSAAERWINCPASVELSELVPDTSSVYANEGTLAHRLAAYKVEKSLGYNTALYEDIRKDDLYTQDMEDYTDDYCTYVESKRSEYKKPATLIETRVDLSFIAPNTFGTADCIILAENTVHIIDFKYGKNVEVSAINNPQMRLYALGVLEQYDGLVYNIDTVYTHIVQPRMNNFSSEKITKGDLKKWYEETVKPKAEIALNEKSDPVPGDWCMFCRAKAICKSYGHQYDTSIAPDDPRVLDYSEIAKRIIQLDALNSYLKKLKEFALQEALKGRNIPGFKVVEGRSNRKWSDQDAAFKYALSVGLKEDKLYQKKPITPPAFEKLVGKKKFKNEYSQFVDKPRGKPTLVEDSDSREEYVNIDSALEDFKDIEI